MRIIGDIHGRVYEYEKLVRDADESIQIGDFGMGFLYPPELETVEKIFSSGDHKFFRGNHDDPARCKSFDAYIPDGTYDADRNMMMIGGAWSIDGYYRRARDAVCGTTSWWPDEECSVPELARIHAQYLYHKPSVVLSHDAPTQAAKEMFFDAGYNMMGPQTHTRTADMLQTMFEAHQPDLWVFGHWHISATKYIGKTKFVCLAELEHMDVNL